MLGFFIKRLLYALPSLWLIVTLIFILSRLLPGSFASENILHSQSESYYSKSDKSAKQQAYQNYLLRTGQHLPLFYFSVTANPEPDTLYKVYPESERLHLQKLAWQYGNWPLVTAYYKNLQRINPTSETKPALEMLRKAVDGKAILSALADLKKAAPYSSTVQELEKSADNLIRNGTGYTYLLPKLHWHGTQNQYHTWLAGLFTGDAGNSFRDSRPVQDIILEALLNTWIIVLISLLLSCLLAMELAILFLQRPFIKLKQLIMPVLFLLDSVPLFVLCLLLLVFFANPDFLQLFPAYGMGFFQTGNLSWTEQFINRLPFLILPILSLTLAYLPYITNQFYRAMLDADTSDYVRTARAKGLSHKKVIRLHIFRNAWLPMITVISDFIPALVAGAVITETIFAVPGMGSLLVASVQARDYPIIVAIVFVVALVRFVSHLLADAAYMLADPRIRLQR
ncbi:ABC transporter permease [Pontibacter arcticus]|uniref:ABC transmembrane type-1 domain-containing protein n=1 Tax=Pontibacter arcticus TaxID=2080288 RepID=A0A364RGB9_9BACT|nr:ABC transporter permease [Pontibacter arcticus]RAU83388.1 hypothetical protein DP923_09310 [Pontibacter arcticus]